MVRKAFDIWVEAEAVWPAGVGSVSVGFRRDMGREVVGKGVFIYSS